MRYLACSLNPFSITQSVIAGDTNNPTEQKVLATCNLDALPEILNVASRSFQAYNINLFGPDELVDEIAANTYKYNSIYCHNKPSIVININP